MSAEFKEDQGPPKFTPLFDEQTERKIAKMIAGQANWPDLDRTDNARCRTCAHFVQAKTRKANGELRDGQCRLWKDRMPKTGKSWPKFPYASKACKDYRASDNPPPAFVRVSAHG